MKRILSLVLALILAAAVLCSASASVLSDAGYTPEVSSITISVINRALEENNEVELYLEKELGIDIEFLYLQGDPLTEKINLWLAGGEKLPDMMTLSSEAQYNTLLSQGALQPIEELLQEYCPNVYASRTEEWINRLTEKDGHIYTLDNYDTIGDNQGVLIRKDWLDKLGLEMPDSPEDLYEVLHAFVYDDPDGNGENDTYGYYVVGSDLNNAYKSLLPAFHSNPEQWIWKDGEIVYGATCVEENAAAIEFLHDLYAEGLINADYMTATTDDRLALLHESKIGCLGQVSVAYCNPTNNDYCGHGEQWVALNRIYAEDGTCGVLSYSSPETVHAYGACITKDCVDPIACMMYINMICTKDMQNLIVNGIEGKHWAYDENGIVTYIEPYTDATLRYAEGYAYSYTTPCMWGAYPPFQNSEQVTKDYNEKFELSQDYFAAMMKTPAQITEQLLAAGMGDYIKGVYHDLIMNGGDYEAALTEMVNTLYAEYNLAQQEEIRREYGHENGYYD